MDIKKGRLKNMSPQSRRVRGGMPSFKEEKREFQLFLSVKAFLVVCVLLLSVRVVGAHGGGVAQVVNRPISTHTLSVWTSPDPAQAGTLHITAALADSNNNPVLNQAITVAVVGDEGDFSAEATHDNAANKLFYEADFEDIPAGQWLITIALENESDTIEFPLTVEPKSWFSTVLIALIATVLVIAIWVFSRRTSR